MVVDLMGFGWNMGFMHYGETWRKHRQVFHVHFNSLAVPAFQSIQTRQARNILRQFPKAPNDFPNHFKRLAGTTIMEMMYGIKSGPTLDHYIELVEKVVSAVTEAGNTGAFLVDSLPILKYVPTWMPGAGFKRKALEWREIITQMRDVPFMAAKNDFLSGTAPPCVTASLLENLGDRTDAPSDSEEIIRNCTSIAYASGSDTMVSALEDFILAMVLYPEVQRKAQEELDSVIGMERLPGFDDRKDLPYINALCKEVLRWHPVVPLGIPHKVMQDDVYGDYFIPKGCIVFGNAWTILHDENIYGPETKKFRPERFLVPGVKYPSAAFGFGRRLCPGRHLADNLMFIAIASILKVFNISHARDDLGNDILVEAAFKSGFVSRPEPFQCAIEPRSAQAEKLIEENHEDIL